MGWGDARFQADRGEPTAAAAVVLAAGSASWARAGALSPGKKGPVWTRRGRPGLLGSARGVPAASRPPMPVHTRLVPVSWERPEPCVKPNRGIGVETRALDALPFTCGVFVHVSETEKQCLFEQIKLYLFVL